MSPAPSRFSRLLAMVPYFLARQGIEMSVAAAELGVTQAQLKTDLEQLYVCGLPGHAGGDLIDIQFWDGYVTVLFTAGIDRPLRLTGTEANVLLVALRMLLDAQGALAGDAIRRAVAKVEEAAGASRAVVIDDGTDRAEHPASAAIREAVAAKRALALRYYTPSRDALSERIVDPIRVQVVDGTSYLDAWCRESQGRRIFRFDRVQEATVLPEASNPPADVVAVPVALPTHDASLPVARLAIDPSAVWVVEYYQARLLEEADPADPTAPVLAELTYASPEWLARLVQSLGGRVSVVSDDDRSRRVRALIDASAGAALARYGAVAEGGSPR